MVVFFNKSSTFVSCVTNITIDIAFVFSMPVKSTSRKSLITNNNSITSSKTRVIWGEFVTYAEYNPLRQALFWIHLIEFLWFLAYFIMFTIVSLGARTWFNNGIALLIYVIGTSVVILLAQIVSVSYYFNAAAQTPHFDVETVSNSMTGDDDYKTTYANYMGMSHAKELVMAVIVTIVCSAASNILWYDWLNTYKTVDLSLNLINTDFDTPPHIIEFNTYQTLLHVLMLLQLVPLVYLMRALWAHIKPLRAITYVTSTD